MLNENQTDRLAGAINALRPDWPVASLRTFIANKLGVRAYQDAALALTYVATDSKTQTPARVLESGPWWRTNPDGSAPRSFNTPCPDHKGEILPCGRCANERVPADDNPAALLARANLSQTLAQLCPHKVDRRKVRCGECELPRPEPTPQPERDAMTTDRPTNDEANVCIAHGAFIPCRKSGEHRYTSNPYWVKSVRDYQGSDIEGLTWEPAWVTTNDERGERA